MKTNTRKLENKLSRLNTSHVLHLILSIISMGIWVPVWILVTISNATERSSIIRELNKAES